MKSEKNFKLFLMILCKVLLFNEIKSYSQKLLK